MSAGVKENPSLKQNFRRRVQEPAYDLQNICTAICSHQV
jgi:hypothetical protein